MRQSVSILLFILLAAGIGIFTSCNDDDGLNIFTLEEDRQFGRDFDQEIRNNDEFDVLDEAQYSSAYGHLNRIKNDLLGSDDLNHREDFDWKARIIKNDTVLNAFAVPGGYMYFYTGLIRYLDNEAQFAGVMAHEMAHVDKRHTTQRMTKIYGFQFLTGLLLGEDPDKWAEIAADLALGLGQLQFSRNDEYEADEFAVKYTADTDLYPKGVAGFFIKLEDEENRPKIPEFLSTHPSPDNRIEQIDAVWKDIDSPTGDKSPERYREFKNALPE
ncbi:MAG: M48 family metalloprotease [Bacteroidales bacterium]|nr:M48 family metalloprotease [Bacteroidales bacterium]